MEQNDFNSYVIVMIMWFGTFVLSVGSGILAWKWIEPHSFLGVIGFIFLWGILSKVGHFIMFGIIYSMFDRD